MAAGCSQTLGATERAGEEKGGPGMTGTPGWEQRGAGCSQTPGGVGRAGPLAEEGPWFTDRNGLSDVRDGCARPEHGAAGGNAVLHGAADAGAARAVRLLKDAEPVLASARFDSSSDSEDRGTGLPGADDSQCAVFLCSVAVCFWPQGFPDGSGIGQR